MEARGWSLKQPVVTLKAVKQPGLKALLQPAASFLFPPWRRGGGERLAARRSCHVKMESILQIKCAASVYPSSRCAHESAATC